MNIISGVAFISACLTAVAASGKGFLNFAGFDTNPTAFINGKPHRRYGGSYYKPYGVSEPTHGNRGVKYGYKDGFGHATIVPYGGHSYGQKATYQYGTIDENNRQHQVPDVEPYQDHDLPYGNSYSANPSYYGNDGYEHQPKKNGLLQDNNQQAYSYKLGYGYTESKNYGLKGVGTLTNRDVSADAGYEAGYDYSQKAVPSYH